ncbi:MAG: hypothetical protein N2Z79_03185 [Candidatus Omnitrophica bacterium]|nr:hypothetical protein [Candidatus Omnitrophota bacterium]
MERVVFSERKTVQNPILKYTIEIGWQYVEPEKALELRESEAGILFLEVFKEKLLEFNPWLEKEDLEYVIREI